jgi:hypothetical protein
MFNYYFQNHHSGLKLLDEKTEAKEDEESEHEKTKAEGWAACKEVN